MYIIIIKDFHFDMRYRKYPYVCRRTKLPGRGVHSEEVRGLEVEVTRKHLICMFLKPLSV